LPTSAAVTAGILLAIPVLALLIVPIYASEDPSLWGFPFFYWYQLLWVFLASGFTYSAHKVIVNARGGEDR
jgi:hypothetical protein